MEIFPIETLMEEIKPSFREKYVFDSEGKSTIVSTLGLLLNQLSDTRIKMMSFKVITSYRIADNLNHERKRRYDD